MNTLLNRNQAPTPPIVHESHHGFCSICGMVWPCSWARRHEAPAASSIPTARLRAA
jgi:hypothetical protein